jgi:divalent metal cation (Fe/Co/Zn/Cd) transporter
MIFSAGIELGKKSFAVLMDEAPVGVSADICSLAKTVEGVVGVHDVNVRSLDGTKIFTDLSIFIDGDVTLHNASVVKNKVKYLVESKYEGSHVIVHIDTKK